MYYIFKRTAGPVTIETKLNKHKEEFTVAQPL